MSHPLTNENKRYLAIITPDFDSKFVGRNDFQHACLTTTRACTHATLHALDITLELLDDGVGLFEILIQAVSFMDELLLPSSESLLLDLDLLCETLPQCFFLLLEFGVVQLPRSGLAELASLHLLCAVYLVVVLLGRVDQVEHVIADKDGSELAEVAVVLVLNLGDTPGILAALDAATVGSRHILLRSYHRERHGVNQFARVGEHSIIVVIERGLVDFDTLGLNNGPYSVLEAQQIIWTQGVRLGNDWDQVDPGAKTLHDFNVKRLKSMPSGTDKVQAGVNTEVDPVNTARLLFLKHVGFVLVVKEFNDWLP